MIDQSSIRLNSQKLQDSLEKREDTALENLYVVRDVLGNDIVEKLRHYLLSDQDLKWQIVSGQENKPRYRISWDFDTVIEELHEVFENATSKINEIFPGVDKNFWGISLWKDQPEYRLKWHTDNPDIDVAIQLYLYTDVGYGTEFKLDDTTVIVDSHHNTGYFVCYSGGHQIPHQTQSTVPEGMTRYSLYAIWSRFPKHAPDA